MKYSKYVILVFILALLPIGISPLPSESLEIFQSEIEIPIASEDLTLNATNFVEFPFTRGSGTMHDPYFIQAQENVTLKVNNSRLFVVVENCQINNAFLENSSNIVIRNCVFAIRLFGSLLSNINITQNSFQSSSIKIFQSKFIQIIDNSFQSSRTEIWSCSEILIQDNSFQSSGNGIEIWSCSEILIQGNQIQHVHRGISIGYTNNSRIIDNDIGNSFNSYYAPGFFSRKMFSDYVPYGIYVPFDMEIAQVEIRNNTIHNIFGIGLNYESDNIDEIQAMNHFSQNYQDTNQDTWYESIPKIYRFYLIFGTILSTVIFCYIYLKIVEEKWTILWIFVVIYLLSLPGHGFLMILELLGIYFMRRKKNPGENILETRFFQVFLVIGMLLALSIGIIHIIEEIMLYRLFGITWQFVQIWELVFIWSTFILWLLSFRTLKISKQQYQTVEKEKDLVESE